MARRHTDTSLLRITPLLNWNKTAAMVGQLTLTLCKPRLMTPAGGRPQ